MTDTGAADFVDALVLVIENPVCTEQVRLDACQTLAGRLMGRVLAPQQVKKQLGLTQIMPTRRYHGKHAEEPSQSL
jgi:hypothetical protein